MKIYKFKDLSDEKKHNQFYEIVLENKFWCASPKSLNDEEEFKFELDYTPSSSTQNLFSLFVWKINYGNTNNPPPGFKFDFLKNQELEKILRIEDRINRYRNEIGIASFSRAKNDHLWNEYGGKGNGACIEIIIPKQLIGKSFRRVDYVPKKIFHVDSFLDLIINDRDFEIFQMMFLTKTANKWAQEEEIRFIAKVQGTHQSINGYISEITFGSLAPATVVNNKDLVDYCNSHNIKIIK